MKEWTDDELFDELMSEGLTGMHEGEVQPFISLKKIEQIMLDPRLPESKKAKVVDFFEMLKQAGAYKNLKNSKT